MKTVFISRKLSADSIFKKELEAAGFKIHDLSLIKFSAVAFSTIPSADWIFFYSKNAVKFFFAELNAADTNILKNKRWAALGPGTAKVLRKHQPEIDFVGDGNTVETAAAFLELAAGETVLFPRAERSRKTIQQLLKGKISDRDLIVYRNVPKQRFNLPDCDLLVFTSPMNVRTYFKKKDIFDDQQVFAIGRTTAKALASVGILDFQISEQPSEEALVRAILRT